MISMYVVIKYFNLIHTYLLGGALLKAQIDERIEKTRVIQKASEEAQKKLQSMEESFTKLKQVTGMYVYSGCMCVCCM